MTQVPAVRVDSKLAESPARNRTFMLPDLLSDLIDELVARAGAAGYSTGRGQVVAGLIYAARDCDAAEIESVVREYLLSEVSTVVDHEVTDGVVRPRPTSPGRRPRARD